MQKKRLSKKDIKELNQKLEELAIDFSLDKKDIIEHIKDKEQNIEGYLYKKDLILIELYNKETNSSQLIPTLKFVLKYKEAEESIPKIIIDMPAVKFICNGADVMRPGIKEIPDNTKKDSIVIIADETHKKPLAIGIANLDATEMKAAETGKVIKNIIHVNDIYWNYM